MENNNFLINKENLLFMHHGKLKVCKKWKLQSEIWCHVHMVPSAHTDPRSTMCKPLFWHASVCVLFLLLCTCASRMPVQVNHVSSCRPNGFAVLPLDIITHSSFVQKQVVATSMCCYLHPALSNGLICSHTPMILLTISVRLCVVNRTVLGCLSYVVTTHISWMAVGPQINTCMVGRVARLTFECKPKQYQKKR